jgi:hypothetical protein
MQHWKKTRWKSEKGGWAIINFIVRFSESKTTKRSEVGKERTLG